MYLGDGYIAWPILFPQHGPGRKHLRPIILEPWQRAIVERHPAEFVRGCLESDGCRHRRLVAGRNDPAYSFKSHSADILALFVWACRLLGLRPRRANRVTISIARRADVARPDGVVEHDGAEHASPTLHEPMASYRARASPAQAFLGEASEGTVAPRGRASEEAPSDALPPPVERRQWVADEEVPDAGQLVKRPLQRVA
jgi:hypothetical protein